MIGADAKFSRPRAVGLFVGSLVVNGANWTFGSDTSAYAITKQPVTGSGTFSAKTSMDGTYSVAGSSSSAWGPLDYNAANALAVSQASVSGRWATTSTGFNLSIDVGSTGAFTGATSGNQIGACNITGQVRLATPGSAKNFYVVTLRSTNAASGSEPACKLAAAATYTGPAAIVFRPAGTWTTNGYFRQLTWVVSTADGAYATVTLNKQP